MEVKEWKINGNNSTNTNEPTCQCKSAKKEKLTTLAIKIRMFSLLTLLTETLTQIAIYDIVRIYYSCSKKTIQKCLQTKTFRTRMHAAHLQHCYQFEWVMVWNKTHKRPKMVLGIQFSLSSTATKYRLIFYVLDLWCVEKVKLRTTEGEEEEEEVAEKNARKEDSHTNKHLSIKIPLKRHIGCLSISSPFPFIVFFEVHADLCTSLSKEMCIY